MTRRPVDERDTVNSLFLLSKGKPTNASSKCPPSTVAMAKDDSSECLCPSTSFARSLKTSSSVEYKPQTTKSKVLSVKAVTAFDFERFHLKCNPTSPDFDATIDLDKVSVELFKLNEVWASRDLAYSVLEALAECHGFTASKRQNFIGCNRYGKPKDEDEGRSFSAGPLLANCTMRMWMTPLSREPYKANVDSKKWSYRDIWTGPIRFFKGCPLHGGNCVPSAQNRVATNQRARTCLFVIFSSQIICH